MRPIKLIVSAFGPYAGETLFELDKLSNKGIYLITGDTGAGKTTIFDAITYALYGEPSGAVRDTSLFRSTYADKNTATYVELEFEYSGNIYYVKRNPEYERAAKRGEGMATQKAEAELKLPDGRVITKVKDVNDAIRNILGIDRSQFTQIAMIAQGEFLKLILASTEERQKIFREIFGTNNYRILQDKIKIQSLELGKRCEGLRSSLKQYIDGVSIKEENLLYSDLMKAKDGDLSIADTIELIKNILNEDEKKNKTISDDLDKVEKELTILTNSIGKAEEIKKSQNILDLTKIELQEKKSLEVIFMNKLRIEKEKEPIREDLYNEILQVKNQITKYNNLETLYTNLENRKTSLEKLKKAFDDENKELLNYQEQIKNNKLEFAELRDIYSILKKYEDLRDKYLKEKKQLADLFKEVEILKDLNNKMIDAQNKYRDISIRADELKNIYNEKYKLYFDEQAGILAQTLEEGKPCPVCGSLEHPRHAVLTSSAPSKEELERAKKEAEIEDKKLVTQSETAGKYKAELEMKKDYICKVADEILEDYVFEKIQTTLKTKYDEIIKLESENNTLLNKTEIKKNRYEELSNKIPKMEELLNEKITKISDIQNSISSINTEISMTHENYDNLKKELIYSSRLEAENIINNKTNILDTMKKQLEEAEKNIQNIISEIQTLEGKITLLENQIKNSESINIEELDEKANELRYRKQMLMADLLEINSRVDRNKIAIEGIEKQSNNLLEEEIKYTWMKSLSNTANGNIAGKEKIMLETYIQMTYFDRIIDRANTRFMIMSGGQYELKRRVETQNNRSQSGLELDVIDYYNGSQRSVKSLSGGESFKASLSLALGLSDEIQASAGGIKLDTMFIDEGFGSLDDESLKQAINTLASLSDGNRLIGIISHVAELKEKIDKQIIIRKDKTGGSFAEIVY